GGERRGGREEDGTSWDHPRDCSFELGATPREMEAAVKERRGRQDSARADAGYMRRPVSTVKARVPKRGTVFWGASDYPDARPNKSLLWQSHVSAPVRPPNRAQMQKRLRRKTCGAGLV